MTTVIYHRADFDGLFSAAVCAKFLPGAEFIGWDFGDPLIPFPAEGPVYIVDLPPDCISGPIVKDRIVWIDHHKSSIDKWDGDHRIGFAGYRIDGVAACRLCWQWFEALEDRGCDGPLAPPLDLPVKEDYVSRSDRLFREPLALTLAGEYDVWDLRDDRAQAFQYGLTANSETVESLALLLDLGEPNHSTHISQMVAMGCQIRKWQQVYAAQVCNERSYIREWEGRTFCVLASCHARNSMWFPQEAIPKVCDALMCWRYDGKTVSFSLYHAPGHEQHDLSPIAVKYGGGGHRGACGFSLSLDKALEVIR